MTNISTRTQSVKTAQSAQQDRRIFTLEAVIVDMDASSAAGFGQIQAIAKLAALSFETVEGNYSHHIETIAAALDAIGSLSETSREYVRSRAEEVECQSLDPRLHNRFEASRLAEKEMSELPGQASKGAN